jgi:hypothetical protein
MNIIAHNIFIVPVLEYVAQLLPIGEKVTEATTRSMRKLASGPGNWVELRDLENLTAYGLPADMRTIGTTAKAAKLRVAMTIASDARTKCRDLEVVQMEFLRRPFGTWHQQSFYKILNDNRIELDKVGVTVAAKRSAGDVSREQQVQNVARRAIKTAANPYNVEMRVRKKIQRWKLQGPEAIVACRIIRNCAVVGAKCRPCIAGTFFRTLWNGWPTTWRMRTMPGAADIRPCLLGCASACDRIEHYLVCPIAWGVLQTHRGIELHWGRKCLQAMFLALGGLEEREVMAIAIAVYAIARTVQPLRAHECSTEPLLKLHLNEGLKGRRPN